MTRLKADLHAHCGDDAVDLIAYSAEMLIDAAAQLNIDVLAIACHERLVHSARLAAYAERRSVLLMPAIELLIEGKHVVVLNPSAGHVHARTFEDLHALDREDAVVLAPHPYFIKRVCLGRLLADNIDIFDAVEYSSFHFRGLNLNRRAIKIARESGLPMLGTSDAHKLYSDRTHTWIEAERTVAGVVEAIRAGRVAVETQPQELAYGAWMVYFACRETVRQTIERLQ